MMNAKEKLYFFLNKIVDIRAITPEGKPIRIHPTSDLNRKLSDVELDYVVEKLESDDRVIEVVRKPNDLDLPINDLNVGCYLFVITDKFEAYYSKIQHEPEYQKFTGKKVTSKADKVDSLPDRPTRYTRKALEKIWNVLQRIDEKRQISKDGKSLRLPCYPTNPDDDVGEWYENRKNILEKLSSLEAINNLHRVRVKRQGKDYHHWGFHLGNEYQNVFTDYEERYNRSANAYKEAKQEEGSEVSEVKAPVWFNNFRWEGKDFAFDQYGDISFTSSDREHIFRTLTNKKGGWATIKEMRGDKSDNYVRATIGQIKKRLPKGVREWIKIVSTRDDDREDKPIMGAYRIKVLQKPKPL
ncbi:MAG: hypothetical protein KKB22_04215 [Candidatus Omnitrophica bacterium]|nr:hypothetical protein [Candidatus Omnitrophota bacterium]